MKIELDFETRSTVDIKKRGAAVYAEDSSTDIQCLDFKIDDGPVKLLTFKDHIIPLLLLSV